MAVPSNPKLTDVYAEFGAPAGTPLTAFVRGGSWVPNTAANAGVPTAPPISLSQLAGATRYTPITLSGPTTYTIGPIDVNRPPITETLVTSLSVAGGQGTITYTWAKQSGNANTSCNNTAVLNPTFSATGNQGSNGSGPNVATTTDVWTLTASDGQSSPSVTVTINVQRYLPA